MLRNVFVVYIWIGNHWLSVMWYTQRKRKCLSSLAARTYSKVGAPIMFILFNLSKK
jgi:hypothetical protein